MRIDIMDKKQFHHNLKVLHQELSSVKQADPDSMQLIKQIHSDIDAVLNEQNHSDKKQKQKSLLKQLQDSSEYFEVSHPRLTNVVNNIISTLNNLGI